MSQIHVDPTTGQHTATLTQRELATLRIVAHWMLASLAADALRAIAGDCGDENCEACSLDGDDAHDAYRELCDEE